MKFDDDLPVNPSGNPHLNQLIERAVSRRAVLKSGFGLATLSFLGLSACGGGDGEAVAAPTEFGAVGTSSADRVVVPDGYRADALYRWGDPLTAAAPDFASDASQDWRAQEQQAGDNHDGMSFFPFRNTDGSPRSDAGLLVMNHEYINPEYFYQPGTDPDDWLLPFTLDKARKAQAAHGVSVVEVRRGSDGAWQYVRQSAYNRRITGYTPIELSGPAAGHELLRTAADPAGVEALGTLNNCANGATPWGTYLTCEENFNGYFGWNGDHTPTALENRYGLSAGGAGYRWHTVDARFDVEQNPNEPNRFGWIVEIDPMQPASKPKKRTALGRFKHENAEVVLAPDGRAVVYMGDDERNDYIYKFVSARRYDPSNTASGRDLLDEGTLYVARFAAGPAAGDDRGTGEWIALVFGQNGLDDSKGFSSQADILIRARQAADRVGATMMDRPEWIAANPKKAGEVYCTLTNNNRRGTTPASSNQADGSTTGGGARPATDEANPRANNLWGHIIRWNEAGGDAAATRFDWDIFLLAGNPGRYPDRSDRRSGSAAINAENMFNSPDGLLFDHDGHLWIQSDGANSNSGDYAGQGNNQMLRADVATGQLKRFFVGPAGCEVTGLAFTPDMKTMFVNIQHPGELGSHPNVPRKGDGTLYTDKDIARDPTRFSTWPDGAAAGRPRSATVVVRRVDGGRIGT